MYTITCDEYINWIDTIEALVHRGLHFKANLDDLTIELTGAF